MSGTNVNEMTRNSTKDRGFWRNVPISLNDFRTTGANPAILTGVTTPKGLYSSGSHTVSWDAAATTAALVSIPMPYDYAQGLFVSGRPVTGSFKLIMGVRRVGTTDATAYLDAVCYWSNLFSANVVNNVAGVFTRFDPSTGTAYTGASSPLLSGGAAGVVDYVESSFPSITSGGTIVKPGDRLCFQLAPVNNSADVITIHSLVFSYRSNARPHPETLIPNIPEQY